MKSSKAAQYRFPLPPSAVASLLFRSCVSTRFGFVGACAAADEEEAEGGMSDEDEDTCILLVVGDRGEEAKN